MLIFRPLLRYAGFKGRASRSEYWLFMVFQSVVYITLFVLAVGTTVGAGHDAGAAVLGLLGWLGLIGLTMLALTLPNYALLARRLHDIGLSALWMALLLPGVFSNFAVFRAVGLAAARGASSDLQALAHPTLSAGDQMAQTLAHEGAAAGVLTLIAMACNLALFVMTLTRGQSGPNRFGLDPKNPETVAPSEALDGDRWDDLIAEAQRERQGGHAPVFDFSPGAESPRFPGQTPQTTPQGAAAWSSNGWPQAPSGPPVFGRRRS